MINLGTDDTIPRGVYARPASALIPNVSYIQVPDALHFSFLAECKPAGGQILRDEGEPGPICEDTGGRSRAELHDAFRNMIPGYLDTEL